MGFVLEPKPVDQGIAIAALVVNILVPGLGTIIYGISADDLRIARAILQFVGAFILIGWISAVIDGVKILMAASPKATVTAR